jgi:hypothetical protein
VDADVPFEITKLSLSIELSFCAATISQEYRGKSLFASASEATSPLKLATRTAAQGQMHFETIIKTPMNVT